MSTVDRLLRGYQVAVAHHKAASRAHHRAQRLFLRILDRTRMDEGTAYAIARADAADGISVYAYQAKRAALWRLARAFPAANDIEAIVIRGAVIAARADERDIANSNRQ